VGYRFETRRVELFSDAVFAIAITLLVLEISVPADEFDSLWRGIADQWPSYLAYATSFWTIGGVWLVHHGIFRRMRSADMTVMRLNLLLLMVVAFLPFPTKLMAEVIESTSAERAAVLFYGATLLAISAIITAIGRYVMRHSDLLAEGVQREEIKSVTARATPSVAFYGLLLALAVLVPQIAVFGLLAVAVLVALLPARPATPKRA